MDESSDKTAICRHMVRDILKMDENCYNSSVNYSKTITQLARKYKHVPSKSEILVKA